MGMCQGQSYYNVHICLFTICLGHGLCLSLTILSFISLNKYELYSIIRRDIIMLTQRKQSCNEVPWFLLLAASEELLLAPRKETMESIRLLCASPSEEGDTTGAVKFIGARSFSAAASDRAAVFTGENCGEVFDVVEAELLVVVCVTEDSSATVCTVDTDKEFVTDLVGFSSVVDTDNGLAIDLVDFSPTIGTDNSLVSVDISFTIE